MRLIDADALKEKWQSDLDECLKDGVDYIDTDIENVYADFIKDLDGEPTIDQRKFCEECQLDDCIALTRKHGKWVCPKAMLTTFCSECGYVNNSAGDFNYCPNCGADMRGE